MPLNLLAERREPSGEVRETSAKPDGLRRSATMTSLKSVALGAKPPDFAKYAPHRIDFRSRFVGIGVKID